MKRWLVSALVLTGTALALVAQTRTPKPRSATIAVPAGPASLTAGSSVTGQIWLAFPWVPTAQRYRVTRSSNAPEPEQTLYEGEASAFGVDAAAGAYHNAPVSPGYTYSYKVYAVFVSPTGITVSSPSPTASSQSAPFLQPSNLKSSIASSPVRGMTNVTLTWGAVPNAEKYRITVEGRSQPYETSATSLLVSSVPAGKRYRVCVGTVYPYNVSHDASATCTTVKS